MKVLKIHNADTETLDVEFVLGNVCNYKCHYCFPGCHEGTHRWPDHEIIVTNIKKLFAFYKKQGKKKIDLKIIGGEPTLWPHLETFVEEIKKDVDVFVRISTNASRTIKYWQEKSHLFDEITISVHNEFVKLDHIIEVANFIHEQKRSNLYVYVLMDPNNWARSLECFNYLMDNSKEWFLAPQPVLFNNLTVYDSAQTKYLSLMEKRQSVNPRTDKKPNIIMQLEHSLEEPYDYKKIVLSNANRFYGYNCNLGLDRIYISIDGDIKGACGEVLFKNTLNIKDKNFQDRLEMIDTIKPVLCGQTACGCAAEIKLTKNII